MIFHLSVYSGFIDFWKEYAYSIICMNIVKVTDKDFVGETDFPILPTTSLKLAR